jgi:hypothetical protein
MRWLSLLSLLPLVAEGPAAPARLQEALMDEIERAIVLPRGAQPMNRYGRNYASSGPDRVVATYLMPPPPLHLQGGCEVVLKDLTSRPCTKSEIVASAKWNADAVKSNALRIAAQSPAGERRWYNNARSLPFINEGGCMQVWVEYDTKNHRVVALSCNGYG